MFNFKTLKKKKLKLFLKIKERSIIRCKKLTSKIFYNLTYIYIKNNFLLINKLLNVNFLQNSLLKTHYNFKTYENINDLFILNYLDNNFNNKSKTMITVNKTKKPLSIITVLKKIIFSKRKFFRLIKNEKKFLKLNIYNIYFFLFYYYMNHSFSYLNFYKINNNKNRKKKNLFFTLNIFLKKNLKKSFKFFFKNIIMFLYKYSLIKNKKKKLFKIIVNKKRKKIFKKFNKFYITKKKRELVFKKAQLKIKKIYSRTFKYLYRIEKYKNKKHKNEKYKINNKKKNKKSKKKNIFFFKKYKYKKKRIFFFLKKKKRIKKSIKNFKKFKFFKLREKLLKLFKRSLKKKKNLFFFKKLFLKKTLVKRTAELSFKKDIQLKNAATILKNNKKFKFLTFPINSICKFFFKNSMYNIFMTLIVLPNNLTIGNYSGGHFNILSKRRDRGSINSLKSMSKLISLKIYQSNLSFIIFCPRLFTRNNKRLIKTIFYSFKILNRSPITKIYLYRPVIRNGIKAKKIPRK